MVVSVTGRVRLDLAGDPGFHLLNLAFQEADVLQGQVEDALHGQGQGGVEGKAFSGDLLEFLGLVLGVAQVMAAEFVQLGRHLLDGELGQLVQVGLLGQDETAGHPEQVRERLEPAVGRA